MIDFIKSLFSCGCKTGSEIVTEVVEQFTALETKLWQGIELIDGDIKRNQELVDELKEQNRVLGEAKVKGILLRRGLENLLSGTVTE